MAGALVGATSCARCATAISASERYCTRCGVLLIPASPGSVVGTYSGMLAGVFPAAALRRNAAIAIDFVPVLLAIATSIIALVSDAINDQAVVLSLLGFVVIYAVLHVFAVTVHGTSLGRGLLKLRTVDDLTGDPVAISRRVRSLRSGTLLHHTVTADLVRGRDPLESARKNVSARALRAASASTANRVEPVAAPTDTGPSEAVTVVLDSGERIEVTSALLVGRAPENKDDDKHPALAWPDLSRSLSKTHALLEWSGTVLWVTDLGSTSGSALESPQGERQLLVAGLRGAAAVGWTIHLGDRTLDVRPSAGPAA